MKSGCIASLVLLLASTFSAASNPVPFVNQPLSPSSAPPGSASFTLTVNGAGFIAGAVVNWNGTALVTTFVNHDQLTAIVPDSDLVAAGTASVTVANPGGGVSNAAFFAITRPLAPLTFAGTTYTVGNSVNGVVAADFDNDGKTDIAIINQSGTGQTCFPGEQTGSVSVLLGSGAGTFTPAWTYDLDCITNPSGKFSAFSVATHDFNGDGKPDLAVTFRSAGVFSVATFLGNGDGTFTYIASVPGAGTGFDGMAPPTFADFNADGNVDFAAGFDDINFSTFGVGFGHGDGTFDFQSPFTDFVGIISQTAGDFNGDGILDLGAGPAFTLGADTPILLGNGDGTFTAALTQPSTAVGFPVISADFNGDGILDLASANSSGNAVDVQLGNGDGTFTDKGSQAVTQIFNVLKTADVNGDGKLDLLIPNPPSTKVSILLGNGDGTFQPQVDFPVGAGPSDVAVADFNNDGRLDVVTANGDATVTVLLNSSTQAAPAVTLSRTFVNFGYQEVGVVSAPMSVTLTNSGTSTLTVSGLGIAGVDRVALAQTNTCGSPIAPGASCTINVKFKPNLKGQTSATVMILDNAGNSPQKISITGCGVM